MAFLDQISKNLAGYGKEAAKKAKDTAEIFQLKAEIRGEKQKINELYAAIGAVYFKNHRDESEDEYKMFFPEIENAMEHIAELEEKLKQQDAKTLKKWLRLAVMADNIGQFENAISE